MHLVTHVVLENFDNSSDESWDLGLELQERCDREFSHDFYRIFVPAVYGIIFVLGFIGNGMVLVVMGYQKKNQNHDGTASTRVPAVVRATNSQATRKLLADRVIYVGVWLPAALLTLPDLVFAKAWEMEGADTLFSSFEDRMETVDSRVICDRIYVQASTTIWIVMFRFQHILVGFVLPGLVIFTCYCIIIKRSQGSKGQALKKKALKTTVILILCFFCCWLPYCLGIFVDTLIMLNVVPHSCELDKGVQKWISITEALAYFHCCLNPILYAFKFKKS
ncbi:hypothetical protein CRUP_014088 [Coryphaenoides rupestris]|nr:hypothetical protein CRUP_014088 [Coryphaenoides rupestris]